MLREKVDLEIPHRLWDLTSVGEENETFFIRVWNPLPSRRVLKILKKKSLKGSWPISYMQPWYSQTKDQNSNFWISNVFGTHWLFWYEKDKTTKVCVQEKPQNKTWPKTAILFLSTFNSFLFGFNIEPLMPYKKPNCKWRYPTINFVLFIK